MHGEPLIKDTQKLFKGQPLYKRFSHTVNGFLTPETKDKIASLNV